MLMNKRLIKIGFLFLLLLFSKINMSQNFEKCGSMLLLQKAIKENKQIESKRNLITEGLSTEANVVTFCAATEQLSGILFCPSKI